MQELLQNLEIAKFEFNLTVVDTMTLSAYKGSAFRGGFGQVFKEIACNLTNTGEKDLDCNHCLLQPRCIYSAVFESPIDQEKAHIMKKYPFSPHPFILEPPYSSKKIYKPGDKMSVGLVLIGKAIDYLPYFIFTFKRLGEIGVGKRDDHLARGKYILSQVKNTSNGQDSEPIYTNQNKKLNNHISRINLSDIVNNSIPHDTDRIVLHFQSPVRLKYEQKFVRGDVAFHMVIRNLLRRIYALSSFYGQTSPPEIDFKGIISKAEEIRTSNNKLRWYDWERYSSRQKTAMKLGGLIGTVDFQGNINDFFSILKAGEVLHVGKGTSFGLGKYSLISPENGH